MGIYLNRLGGQSALSKYSLLGEKLEFIELIGVNVLESNIKGCIAEAGVYKGGSSKLLAEIFPDRDLYMFDSFSGMLEDDSDPTGGHKTGDFADNSLTAVKELIGEDQRFKYCQGWFPESASFLTNETFALVHVDMDYYQSTQSAIEVFWPRLSVGGAIIFDDYGWIACPGVKRALDEFFPNRNDYRTQISEKKSSIAYFKK